MAIHFADVVGAVCANGNGIPREKEAQFYGDALNKSITVTRGYSEGPQDCTQVVITK